jgi:hypothetical protein
MPRRPPPAAGLGIGVVVALVTAGAGVAFPANVVVGVALIGAGFLIAVGLAVWYVIGSRNQRSDEKKAAAAYIAAQRPLLEALSAIARPNRTESLPTAPEPQTKPDRPTEPQMGADSSIPSDWAAPIWRGKQVLPCPFCSYRTVSDPDFQAHMETHTEPPTAALRQEVYSSQRPWAKVPIRCLAQNNMYHQSGVPLDATRTLYTSESRATELEQTGLYERGEVEGHHEVAETHGTEVTCTCGWRGDGALYPFHPNL